MTAPTDPSEWTEVLVLVPCGWEELVSEVLSRPPLTTVAYGQPSLGTDAHPDGFEYLHSYAPAVDDTPAWRAELGEALAALAGATGEPELANLTLRFRPLPSEDWANTWKKVWKPFRVGRLAVVPHHWNGTPKPGDLRLWLEPGAVFGTGRHATTRMCLAAVQERITPGERVLDVGTGTGVLVVAAALCGAGTCVGFDIDPGSERAAAALAEKNGVADRCEFRTGDFGVLTEGDGAFDAVLANIYSDVVQAEAANLAVRLVPGGWFVFSGCPVDHAPATRAAIEAAGLNVEEERRRGRWTTFIGVRVSK